MVPLQKSKSAICWQWAVLHTWKLWSLVHYWGKELLAISMFGSEYDGTPVDEACRFVYADKFNHCSVEDFLDLLTTADCREITDVFHGSSFRSFNFEKQWNQFHIVWYLFEKEYMLLFCLLSGMRGCDSNLVFILIEQESLSKHSDKNWKKRQRDCFELNLVENNASTWQIQDFCNMSWAFSYRCNAYGEWNNGTNVTCLYLSILQSLRKNFEKWAFHGDVGARMFMNMMMVVIFPPKSRLSW